MEVILEKNTTKYTMTIDEEDYDKINTLSPSIKLTKHITPYVVANNGKMLNKFIVDSNNNEIVIHKNGNKLDLRKENLEVLTRKELVDLIRKGKIKTIMSENGEVQYERMQT